METATILAQATGVVQEARCASAFLLLPSMMKTAMRMQVTAGVSGSESCTWVAVLPTQQRTHVHERRQSFVDHADHHGRVHHEALDHQFLCDVSTAIGEDMWIQHKR